MGLSFCTPGILETNFAYSVKLSVQHIVMLRSNDCVDENSDPNYVQRECIDICMSNQYYHAPLGNGHASIAASGIPNDTGNAFDLFIRRVTLEDIWASNDTTTDKPKGPDDCYKRCRPSCDRMIYDITFDRKSNQ